MTLELYNNLPKYFINLKSRTDRKESVKQQVGVEEGDVTSFHNFIPIVATDKTTYSVNELIQKIDFDKFIENYKIIYNPETYLCLLSHYKALQTIVHNKNISNEQWVLIAEDDNQYLADFKYRLEAILEKLKENKFNDFELVILKMAEFEEPIDYYPYLEALNSKDSKWNISNFDLDYNNPIIISGITSHLSVNKKWTETFSINEVLGSSNKMISVDKKSQLPKYVNDTQHLFLSSSFNPYSASLYLIKKKTCISILEKNPKPWWIADDFTKIIDLNKILFTSPFLAGETIEAKNSSISTNREVPFIYNFSEKVNVQHRAFYKYLATHPKILEKHLDQKSNIRKEYQEKYKEIYNKFIK